MYEPLSCLKTMNQTYLLQALSNSLSACKGLSTIFRGRGGGEADAGTPASSEEDATGGVWRLERGEAAAGTPMQEGKRQRCVGAGGQEIGCGG